MKVWMRGRAACCTASQQRSISARPARARPQTVDALTQLGDLAHGLEIAVRGDREAGLDDVDAHLLEQERDLDLLVEIHRGAGRLLAVAQGGVENDDARRRGRLRLGLGGAGLAALVVLALMAQILWSGSKRRPAAITPEREWASRSRAQGRLSRSVPPLLRRRLRPWLPLATAQANATGRCCAWPSPLLCRPCDHQTNSRAYNFVR